MIDLQTFATFGLPLLAIAGGLVALWANHRSAERIRAADAEAARRRSAA